MKLNEPLLRFLFGLAGVCFLLSLAVHVAAWLGFSARIPPVAWGLHGLLFLTFAPPLFMISQIAKRSNLNAEEVQHVLFRSAPLWERVALGSVFFYAFVAAGLDALLPAPKDEPSFRWFSAGWMVMFGASMFMARRLLSIRSERLRRRTGA